LLQGEGKTSIGISNAREVEGIIAVTDELKPESKSAIAELTRLGIVTVMLTGDNRVPAQAVAAAVGIREVKAEGLTNLSVEELVKLKIFKVDGEFIRRAKSQRTNNLDVEDLVNLKIQS